MLPCHGQPPLVDLAQRKRLPAAHENFVIAQLLRERDAPLGCGLCRSQVSLGIGKDCQHGCNPQDPATHLVASGLKDTLEPGSTFTQMTADHPEPGEIGSKFGRKPFIRSHSPAESCPQVGVLLIKPVEPLLLLRTN